MVSWNLVNIGSGDLSPDPHHAITCSTNADLLSIEPPEKTNFNEIYMKIKHFCKK